MRCWCGYQSGARCKLFTYGPDDTKYCHPQRPIQIQTGFTFLVPVYPGCPEKRPINGCNSNKYNFAAKCCVATHPYCGDVAAECAVPTTTADLLLWGAQQQTAANAVE